eukprot:CAMPEP_0202733932 /NCGR_PEP_ID=MMETSP1385-20130828/188423_1 /ASSEMBLY_ACC=CAM_ASM_000861 /TAXON_ID=933848 /ORGANISM="Elphidium margaritaceum" /LENGTH=33 /DNA_ID= /DNA_START= /DNA_END= /DNA_ORIENTATION=
MIIRTNCARYECVESGAETPCDGRGSHITKCAR